MLKFKLTNKPQKKSWKNEIALNENNKSEEQEQNLVMMMDNMQLKKVEKEKMGKQVTII